MSSARTRRANAGGAKGRWDAIKADERAAKAAARRDAAPRSSTTCPTPCPPWPAPRSSPSAPPRSASTGRTGRRSWPRSHEELDEVARRHACRRRGGDRTRRSATCCSPSPIWRGTLGVDAEAALRDANPKFTRRFHHVEARAPRGRHAARNEAGLERLDGYWNEIRAADKA